MNLNFNPIDLLTKEPAYTYSLTREFLNFVKEYKGLYHYATPARIITPALDTSVYDKDTDLTYDKNRSTLTGYKYNVYEYVPIFYTSNMNFNLILDEGGLNPQTNLSVSIIGFDDLTVGSFIMFYDEETFSNIVYEITTISTPLLSNTVIPMFNIELVKSTITKDNLINDLLVNNLNQIYYFDYSLGKFVEKDKYLEKVNVVQLIYDNYIPYFKQYFDYNEEAYYCIKSENSTKEYEKYLNLYFLDYIGGAINKKGMRLDFAIPAAPLMFPGKFTPDEGCDKYHTNKHSYDYWLNKLNELKDYSEQHARALELHKNLSKIYYTL